MLSLIHYGVSSLRAQHGTANCNVLTIMRNASTKKAVSQSQSKTTATKRVNITPRKTPTVEQKTPVPNLVQKKVAKPQSPLPMISAFIKVEMQKKGITTAQDWYKVTPQMLRKIKSNIFEYFKDIHAIAKSIYPQFSFHWAKFQDVTPEALKTAFSDISKQKDFLDNIAEQKSLSDKTIYKIKKQDVVKNTAGSTILSMYNDSMYQMISTIYPNIENLFLKVTDWDIEDEKIEDLYIKYLEEKLGIKNNNWMDKVNEHKIMTINKKLGGNAKNIQYDYVVTMIANKMNVSGLKLVAIKRAVRRGLETAIFPGETIVENEREVFHDKFVVDFYLPIKKVAIEILPEGSKVDKSKEEYCKKIGIHLFSQVVTTSDMKEAVARLMKNIKARVANLKPLKETKTATKAVSAKEPAKKEATKETTKETSKETAKASAKETKTTTAKETAKAPTKEAVKEPTKETTKNTKKTKAKAITEEEEETTQEVDVASSITKLAKQTEKRQPAVSVIDQDYVMVPGIWDETTDVRGDYVFELPKNSMPVFWDGKTLRWRNGNEIKGIPFRKVYQLPRSEPLLGYLSFPNREVQGILGGAEWAWAHARFHILDAPMTSGTYATRYARIKQLSAKDKRRDQFIDYAKYKTFSDSAKFFSHCNTLSQSGMSVIMYDPNGEYKPGVSNDVRTYGMPEEAYLKVVSIFADAKTGIKYLKCEQGNGNLCNVRMPSGYDGQVWSGNIIAISYNGRNIKGNYLEPKFYGIRPDIDWNDVVKEEADT